LGFPLILQQFGNSLNLYDKLDLKAIQKVQNAPAEFFFVLNLESPMKAFNKRKFLTLIKRKVLNEKLKQSEPH
jgi:hypothetical protein